MDEYQFRNTYHSVNPLRCPFEKSILTQHCGCRFHERFNLAEREGIRCTRHQAQSGCTTFLNLCRRHARFALHLPEIVGNLLPHNKEARVQKGALLGLCPDLPKQAETEISDIYTLIEKALNESGGDLNHFAYHKLIPSISSYQPRPKHRRKRRKN